MTTQGRKLGSRNRGTTEERTTIQVRVPGSEALRYEQRAREIGLTVSEWIRQLARVDAGLWTGGRAMTTTTIEITDAQISTLMDEAIAAGDTAQVELCEIALGAGHRIPSDREQRDARRECARVIAAAQAMAEPAYRIVVGERGNEQGHVIDCDATTERGARECLRRELARYGSDGWGRVEYRRGDGWDRLD